MTTIVCMTNYDPHPFWMWYTLPKDTLSFLDKKNSSLVTRIGKDSDQYEKLFADYTEPRLAHNIEMDFRHFKYPYNKKDGYFVIDSGIRGFKWRTHPDLISYIEEVDQMEFKIILFIKLMNIKY